VRSISRARSGCSALDALLALGVDRVLTSGGAASALDGSIVLKAMVSSCRRRHDHPRRWIDHRGERRGGSARASGVREVHVRAAVRVESAMTHRLSSVTLARPQAPGDYQRVMTKADEIKRVMAALS
jgi:copper homeostasis protein